MSDTKYYIPTIEEFHVGFECEYKSQELIGKALTKHIERKCLFGKEIEIPDNELFEQHIINGRDVQFYSLNTHLIKDAFRVKHLDREDIESENWELDCCVEKEWFYIHKTSNFQNGNIRLVFREKEGSIEINSDKFGECFYGILKNKSELKRISIQLGITKE